MIQIYAQIIRISPSYQYVDGLDDINKDLVLLVFDTLRPPGDSVGDGGRHLGLCYFELGTLLSNVSARDEMKRFRDSTPRSLSICITSITCLYSMCVSCKVSLL